ncbi:hypothetical protein Tco_0662864 [Tanacetum coccineum]
MQIWTALTVNGTAWKEVCSLLNANEDQLTWVDDIRVLPMDEYIKRDALIKDWDYNLLRQRRRASAGVGSGGGAWWREEWRRLAAAGNGCGGGGEKVVMVVVVERAAVARW